MHAVKFPNPYIFFVFHMRVVFLRNSRIFAQVEGVSVMCYRCEVQCVCVRVSLQKQVCWCKSAFYDIKE